jgi:purine-binding chemotaxis protein CheW
MSAIATETATETRRSDQLVVFALGGEEYALPIGKVQEIIRFQEPRAVSADDPWVAGVIGLRGKIIPVCDLCLRLGQEAHNRRDAKIVIVDANNGTAGIIVDDVAEVLTVTGEELDALPGTRCDFLEEIAKVGERLIVVIDPERLFAGLTIGE